jgi:hypothetical protein
MSVVHADFWEGISEEKVNTMKWHREIGQVVKVEFCP